MSTPIPPDVPTPVPANSPKRRRTWILVLVAVVASIVALAATAIAGYEAGRASHPAAASVGGGTAGPANQPTPTAAAQPPAPPAAGLTATPNAGPSDINPSAQFTPAYQLQQQLELRPGTGCAQIDVDLDEPRVNPTKGVDMSMNSCNGTQTVSFGQSTASVVTDPNTTPAECADSIRTSALAPNITLPIQPNVVLCVATSLAAAQDQGITRKIAVVVVKAIATDNTVTLVVSAWNVPG